MTESSYINSLAIRPCRSTIKTLPATLPEPWTVVRGQRSKPIGPWSTDLEPWVVYSVSRFKLRGSRLVDAGPGLLGLVDGSGLIRVEGWGRGFGVLARQTCGGDGLVEVVGSDFVWACCEVQILPPQTIPINNGVVFVC